MAPLLVVEKDNSVFEPSSYLVGRSASSTSKDEKRSKVRFTLGIVQEFPVLGREEYTKAERENYFYTIEDRLEGYKKIKKVVKRMKSGKKCKKSSPYRGLESQTIEGAEEINRRIFSCIDAVMDAQEKQWDDDIVDCERIARISRKLSKKSTSLALKRAKSDHKEAIKAYMSMEKEEEANQDSSSVSSDVTDSLSVSRRSSLDPPGFSYSTAGVDSSTSKRLQKEEFGHHRGVLVV